MIKCYTIPEKKMTVAVIKDIENDVIEQIKKKTRDFPFEIKEERYLMPKRVRVTVTCDEEDVYDEEVGKKIARDKLISRYNKAYNKRMKRFEDDLEKFYKIIVLKEVDKINRVVIPVGIAD